MKRAVVFIFVACCAVSALSLAEDAKDSKPPATVSPAGQFSPSTAISQDTTTVTSNSTTQTANATTHAPSTTAHAHNATTHAPSTTAHAHNATTHAPNGTTATTKMTTTTTTAKTTVQPSPQPTPPTNLTVGNYKLMMKDKVCLMAQMALQIRLVSPKVNGTFIVQPNLTKAEGGCEETKANLTLTFKEGYITFLFNKSAAENTVYVDALSFKISYAFTKGPTESYTASNNTLHLFPAKIGHSYSCKSEPIYTGHGLFLDVNQDRMQAFNLTKDIEFGFPDHCPADQPSYRVAIAVGVVLLVLIVIVVVAYLLSRRKRTDGYQTL
ncbi:macrosialin [Toxotes jaculatrix]|uniref:macrosialin n=1 Tax=Toxotes jaculatrix TaxID=941984 RepID=UPI001B3AD8B8|nr:macrosialin [Toxotes jaculatrix]